MNPHNPSPGFVTRHRFVLLFVALLVFFVFVPILHQVRESLHPVLPSIFEALLFVAVLVGVVVSISTTRVSRILAMGLGLPLAALVALHALGDWPWVGIIRHLVAAAFLGYAIVVMLVFILTSRQVTVNIVHASLCIYLLLGVLWALAYSVIDQVDHAAFRFSTSNHSSAPILQVGKGESTAVLYFSFATLTTLGYGDIVPVSPIARTLATLEAITGQLYLAVLVARLVGLQVAGSIESRKEPSADAEAPAE